jgi:3-deoxy-manno-octulosonate cytidylyltransferase (CMP-KDO synthetase)
MKVVGLIPARYGSSRFPGKPLVKLLAKPMVVWVAELTAKALGKENVFVASENQRIIDVVNNYGFGGIMTSEKALTGTDRVWEAAQHIDADIYINVQGDEPLLNSDDILKILSVKKQFPNEVINGMCPIQPHEDPNNVNLPKVVTNEEKLLVYMSRLPIPGSKSKKNVPRIFWKQVCIYAFNKKELNVFGEFKRKSFLESIEDIEILRFFELGILVRMVETSGSSYAVDTPEDVPVVESALKRMNG